MTTGRQSRTVDAEYRDWTAAESPAYSTHGIRVRLFGETSVTHCGLPVPLPSTKALELLCYLLVHSDRPHTRESLSEVLWPAGHPSVSKGYLRQALWRLLRTLPAGDLLTIGPDWVRVDSDADWWLDVAAFESAYLRARDTPAAELSEQEAADLVAALDLYRGELMATWYHDWCSYERDRQHLMFLSMLEQLMSYCEVHGRYGEGLDYGQRILRLDPARENAHRQLMRLHYRAGDRTSAMRQFQRCAATLDQEFGIAPSAATVALHEQIRADRLVDPGTAGPVRRDADPAAGVHARLDQIQAGLAALHDAVQRHVGHHRPAELLGLDIDASTSKP